MCYEGRISAWSGTLLVIAGMISINLSIYALLAFIPVYLVCCSLKWQIRMEDEAFHVRVLLFGQRVYRKIYRPDEVVAVKFLRIGWAKKAARIKLKQGLPIRIENFRPSGIFRELADYAARHGIAVHKTRDYSVLERMDRTRKRTGTADGGTSPVDGR
ncbi:hypothetical protein [Virgibacillus sediminis]|uniref:Uncharacterized protein n=1 Tax=Virgibacillus sediminis TaxID=202260 RepID=A0ABV7A263_9BACI